MSCQRGSCSRTRPQKYQNSHAFKNDLHDTSHQTKFINSIQVVNVCERCKRIIEWKIKFKKYKPLKAPKKCTKCNEKCVKNAYHTMCRPCASQHHACPKCGEIAELIAPEEKKVEPIALTREHNLLIQKLSERKRRAFRRYVERRATTKEEADLNERNEKEELDHLLNKLKAMIVANQRNDKDAPDDHNNDLDDADDYDSSESDDDDVEKTVTKMTTTKVQKSLLSCKDRGPGPAYNLPSTIGHEKHDPSRYRSPAFTIRFRHSHYKLSTGPGPAYDIYHLTNKGPAHSPAFTITGRPKFIVLGSGPGPGTYQPEKCPPMNHTRRPPAFSLLPRHKDIYLSHDGPGPCAYNVPPCLGPNIPHKKASNAFTIAGRWSSTFECAGGPGPGDYGNPDFYVVKKRHPAFTIKSRKSHFDEPCGPGPAYNPSHIPRKNSPMFSFGIRHSECATNAVKPDDYD